ncbi:MAG: type II toxin-antitoxin system VapC family toxin [Firmicutes bacterium]|nr:type II toxin-antitoxin system VapC family toxin [Bacillota bacterium]
MNSRFVIDASVALSWLLPGEDTNRTLRLRDHAVNERVELFVPPIFWYEVANVLWVAAKRERITQSDAMKALESLLDFQIDVWTTDPLDSLSIAFNQDLSVYDSAYLSIAVQHQAILWTIDNALAKAAQRLNILVEPAPLYQNE